MLRFASRNDFHQTKQCRNFQYSAGTIVSNHGFGYGLYYWHRRRFEAPWGCPFRPCCAMRFGCTLLLPHNSYSIIEISMFTGRLASTRGLLITGSGELCCGIDFLCFFSIWSIFFGRMACFRHSHDLAGNNLPIGVCPRAGQAGWEATAILSHIMSFCNIQRWIPSRSCKLRFVSCFLYLNTAFQKTCDEWSPIPHCIEELYSLQMTHRPSSFMKTSFDPKRLQMQAQCTCDTKLVTLLNCAVSSLRMGQQHQILSPRLR